MYQPSELDSDDSIGSGFLSNTSFESTSKNKTKPGPKLDDGSAQELSQLLTDWKFQYLYPILVEERIDIEVLKNIRTEHILHLTKVHNIALGTAIKFEVQLNKWRDVLKAPKMNNIGLPISVKKSGTNKSNDVLCVTEILRESPKGNLIMRHYEQHNSLNDTCRSAILEIITNYLIHKDIKISCELAKQISLNIVKIFPTEKMEMYYIKQPGKKIFSKVLTKYYYAQRTFQKGGLIDKPTNTTREPKP